MAEGEGFEPPYQHKLVNGFRDRRIQPLCHPSEEVLPLLRLAQKLAESPGFEPGRRGCRLHDFQSCSFSRSDNSPHGALGYHSLFRFCTYSFGFALLTRPRRTLSFFRSVPLRMRLRIRMCLGVISTSSSSPMYSSASSSEKDLGGVS